MSGGRYGSSSPFSCSAGYFQFDLVIVSLLPTVLILRRRYLATASSPRRFVFLYPVVTARLTNLSVSLGRG